MNIERMALFVTLDGDVYNARRRASS